MAKPPIQQGTIVKAWFTPTRGKRKYRVAAVYTDDRMLQDAVWVEIVMISGSYREDDPDCIPLPHRDDGQVPTRLRKPSAICLRETNIVAIADVEPTGGYVPRHQIAEMLKGLKNRGNS